MPPCPTKSARGGLRSFKIGPRKPSCGLKRGAWLGHQTARCEVGDGPASTRMRGTRGARTPRRPAPGMALLGWGRRGAGRGGSPTLLSLSLSLSPPDSRRVPRPKGQFSGGRLFGRVSQKTDGTHSVHRWCGRAGWVALGHEAAAAFRPTHPWP